MERSCGEFSHKIFHRNCGRGRGAVARLRAAGARRRRAERFPRQGDAGRARSGRDALRARRRRSGDRAGANGDQVLATLSQFRFRQRHRYSGKPIHFLVGISPKA